MLRSQMPYRKTNRINFRSAGLLFGLLTAALLLLAACGQSAPAASPAQPKATKPAVEAAAPAKADAPTEAVTETVAATTAMTKTAALTGSLATTETNKEAGKIFVKVGEDPKLGKILVDSAGMTLYLFDKDVAGKSNCSGDCLAKWPALTVKDEKEKLTLGEGVTAKLAVIDRGDGTYQITANGMPLYYFAKDTKAGDTTGQAVGDVWWVLSSDGAKVTTK